MAAVTASLIPERQNYPGFAEGIGCETRCGFCGRRPQHMVYRSAIAACTN